MTSGTTNNPWPDGPDDKYPDYLWPDDDQPDEDERADDGRGRGVLALAVTAVAAAGLGAAAVHVYRDALPRQAPGTAAQGSGPSSAQGAGPAGPGAAHGPISELVLLGKVTAVGRATITIGGPAGQSVTATVTSATSFTGSTRTLSAVRVGDPVAAQIAEANGVARVVSLRDPASQS